MRKGFYVLLGILVVAFWGSIASNAVTISDYVGSGDFSFKDGSAKESAFRFPQGLLAGPQDALYVLDTYNNVLRYVKSDQVTTLNAFSKTVDASGFPFGGHLDGDLKNALFNRPKDLVLDGRGSLYVTDSRNNCIRKIVGQKVYTFSGKGKPGYLDGLPQTALFSNPAGITIDDQNNLYVADSFNNAIRKINIKGEVSTLAGSGPSQGGYLDGAAEKAKFNEPQDVVFNHLDGALYVADTGNGLIRKIKDGKVTTYAGKFTGLDQATKYANGGFKDGFLKSAEFNFPKTLVLNDEGALLVADYGNRNIRVVKGNRVDTLDTSAMGVVKQPSGLLITKGSLYVADSGDNTIKAMNLNLTPYGTKVPLITVNGAVMVFKASTPYVDDTGARLPLKEIALALKGKVTWDAKSGVIKIVMNEKSWVVSGQEGLVVENGIAYVDAVKLGIKLGYQASFDALNNKVTWVH